MTGALAGHGGAERTGPVICAPCEHSGHWDFAVSRFARSIAGNYESGGFALNPDVDGAAAKYTGFAERGVAQHRGEFLERVGCSQRVAVQLIHRSRIVAAAPARIDRKCESRGTGEIPY